MAVNALQAVLDKAAREQVTTDKVPQAPKPSKPARTKSPAQTAKTEAKEKFYRPVREGRRFVGAHFPPEVAKQLRLIAAEDDTTIQALLEQAVDLLFVKKGRARMSTLMNV